MSTSRVAEFSIALTRYLDGNGAATGPLPGFAAAPADLLPLYRGMLRTRSFDAKAVALQRTGRLGTFASSLGQEAVGVGAASAMAAEDVLLPSFRDQAAQLWRGVTPLELLLYWGGDERGSDFAGPREDFPICVPVASHVPHAAGVALAMKLRGEARAALCLIGDGATSKGDFYEALNIAGVWRLPLVVVVANNQWAISVPRAAQSAGETLAQKAIAAGVPGEQVDGNDVIAVRDGVARALERARSGGGASLIEALTYRLTDHTTADDARRYRDDAEVTPHWHGEPVARLRQYLVANGVWSREDEEHALAGAAGEIEQAAQAFLATGPQPLSAMFDHLFARLPASLRSQRDAALGGEADNG
ncbi:MAG: pyruvate dehydrogenase (acetyl-transferring) E1 component subunit alpha [Rhodospirillales bacterium]|nr:pyruvate dehydrogenase (acetyl-transferring) E1 component subunit alpha [Rhodospirillales bacterium]MDE2197385.1 pyruvate dehydrogenase (acetyl-transferring) E1 component subunit alpha [Rhodospirillales bacterium]